MSGPSGDVDVDIDEGSDQIKTSNPTRHAISNLSLLMEFHFKQGCGNTMPDFLTWSHFIQDKLKISIYLSLDKCKICIKLIEILYFTFLLIIMSLNVVLKTV